MSSSCTRGTFCFSRRGCGIRPSTSMKKASELPVDTPLQQRCQTGISAGCNCSPEVSGKAASKSSVAEYEATSRTLRPTPLTTSRKPACTEKTARRRRPPLSLRTPDQGIGWGGVLYEVEWLLDWSTEARSLDL